MHSIKKGRYQNALFHPGGEAESPNQKGGVGMGNVVQSKRPHFE